MPQVNVSKLSIFLNESISNLKRSPLAVDKKSLLVLSTILTHSLHWLIETRFERIKDRHSSLASYAVKTEEGKQEVDIENNDQSQLSEPQPKKRRLQNVYNTGPEANLTDDSASSAGFSDAPVRVQEKMLQMVMECCVAGILFRIDSFDCEERSLAIWSVLSSWLARLPVLKCGLSSVHSLNEVQTQMTEQCLSETKNVVKWILGEGEVLRTNSDAQPTVVNVFSEIPWLKKGFIKPVHLTVTEGKKKEVSVMKPEHYKMTDIGDNQVNDYLKLRKAIGKRLTTKCEVNLWSRNAVQPSNWSSEFSTYAPESAKLMILQPEDGWIIRRLADSVATTRLAAVHLTRLGFLMSENSVLDSAARLLVPLADGLNDKTEQVRYATADAMVSTSWRSPMHDSQILRLYPFTRSPRSGTRRMVLRILSRSQLFDGPAVKRAIRLLCTLPDMRLDNSGPKSSKNDGAQFQESDSEEWQGDVSLTRSALQTSIALFRNNRQRLKPIQFERLINEILSDESMQADLRPSKPQLMILLLFTAALIHCYPARLNSGVINASLLRHLPKAEAMFPGEFSGLKCISSQICIERDQKLWSLISLPKSMIVNSVALPRDSNDHRFPIEGNLTLQILAHHSVFLSEEEVGQSSEIACGTKTKWVCSPADRRVEMHPCFVDVETFRSELKQESIEDELRRVICSVSQLDATNPNPEFHVTLTNSHRSVRRRVADSIRTELGVMGTENKFVDTEGEKENNVLFMIVLPTVTRLQEKNPVWLGPDFGRIIAATKEDDRHRFLVYSNPATVQPRLCMRVDKHRIAASIQEAGPLNQTAQKAPALLEALNRSTWLEINVRCKSRHLAIFDVVKNCPQPRFFMIQFDDG